MGPTWILPAPDGPHVGPMNLAIRDIAKHSEGRSKPDVAAEQFCRTITGLFSLRFNNFNPNMGKQLHYQVWDKITYPFLNFNAIVEVWELGNNLISHFTGYVITYPCCQSISLKGTPCKSAQICGHFLVNYSPDVYTVVLMSLRIFGL